MFPYATYSRVHIMPPDPSLYIINTKQHTGQGNVEDSAYMHACLRHCAVHASVRIQSILAVAMGQINTTPIES
jgi:spermidine synthase